MLIAERKIDNLGRLVMPADMRQKLALCAGDTVCILFDGKRLIIKKI